MMKSFFKKLAFVMALAMVVSMVAPAGSALAAGLSVAYQNGGAVSELNVKAGAEQDLKFLGAPKNWKDLGFAWTSSNEAVATVDQTGLVTAVADGTATITITVGDLTGSVVVNVGDAKAYDVTLGNADNKAMTAAELKKGAALDLNFYGVKDWNKDNYTVAWSVSGDAANVDKNGVVTAVKAGKAVVTASIVNNLTGVAHKVTAVEVTVAEDVNPDAFTVAQKDINAFVLEFNAEKTAEDITKNLKVVLDLGDSDLAMTLGTVTVEGKKATVEFYSNFENGEVYTLTYADHSENCEVVVGEIAKVGVSYYSGKDKTNQIAYVSEEEENDYVTLVPTLYDAAGRDITAKYDLDNFDFEYTISGVEAYNLYKDTFVFYSAGAANVQVTATWIDTNGELQTAPGQGMINVKKRGSISVTFQKAGYIQDEKYDNDNFGVYISDPEVAFQTDGYSVMHNYALDTYVYNEEDTNKYLFAAVFKDDRGGVVATGADYKYGYFTFKSSNEDVLTIDDSGVVVFQGVGKANVLVYFTPYDGNDAERFVGSKAITVKPAIYPLTYKLAATTGTAASHVVQTTKYSAAYNEANEGLNDVKFQLFFYDQNGDQYWDAWKLADYINIDALYNDGVGVDLVASWNGTDGCFDIVADASAFVAGDYFDEDDDLIGTFRYKITMDDVDLTETVKTNSATFALTIKNTKDEAGDLATFFADGTLPRNYFKYAFDHSWGIWGNDVNVWDVKDYKKGNGTADTLKEWTGAQVTANYMSTGNLAIACVPADKLVAKTTTTGEAGYVYYKITAPNKAGTPNVDRVVERKAPWDAMTLKAGQTWSKWDIEISCGRSYESYAASDVSSIRFAFNNWSSSNGYALDGYAEKGSYGVTLYTTKKNDTSLYKADSVTYNVSNSQSEVQFAGLYNEYENKTTKDIPSFTGTWTETKALTDSTVEDIIKQNLKFTYEGYALGEYAGAGDMWSLFDIDFDNSIVTVNSDKSIRVSKLAIVVPLDDNNDQTNFGYTSIVNVGVTIYED